MKPLILFTAAILGALGAKLAIKLPRYAWLEIPCYLGALFCFVMALREAFLW